MNQIEQNAFSLVRIAGDLDAEDLTDNRVRDESRLSPRDFDKAVRYLIGYGYIEDYPSSFVLTLLGEMKYQDLKEAMQQPKQPAPAAFLSYAHFDDEHIIDFFSGYIPELDADVVHDSNRLIQLRKEFAGNSETLEAALLRLRSTRSSGSKLRISSEVIRAAKRRAESLSTLVSSMEKLHTFFVSALQTIDNKLSQWPSDFP